MFDNRKLLSAVLAASMSTMLIPAAAFADAPADDPLPESQIELSLLDEGNGGDGGEGYNNEDLDLGEDGEEEEVTVCADSEGTGYASITAAITAGVTEITLTANVAETITFTNEKEYTIDLNGHTITNGITRDQYSNFALLVNTITVDSDATLTINDNKGNGTVTNNIYGCSTIKNSGTLTIGGGTLTSSAEEKTVNGKGTQSAEDENRSAVVENEGELTVTGGEFSANDGSTAFKNKESENEITITGGTFLNETLASNDTGTISILGGTFAADPSEFIADSALGTQVTGTPAEAKVTVTAGEISQTVQPGQYVVWQPIEVTTTPAEETPSESTTPTVETPGSEETTPTVETKAEGETPLPSYEAAKYTATANGYNDASGEIAAVAAKENGKLTAPLNISLTKKVVYSGDDEEESADPSTPSTSTTETITNEDGTTTEKVTDPTTGTVTETTVADDVTTVKVTDTTGTSTTTVTDAGTGVSAQVTQDATGATTAVTATIPAADTAAGDGEGAAADAPVTLPVTIAPGASAEAATPCTITIEGTEARAVEIPISGSADTTVAAIVDADGNEQIIKLAGATDAGLLLNLEGTSQLKIYDNAKSFADAPADSWYAQAVSYTAAHEIMNGIGGKGATEFAPDQLLSRGMMTEILYNLDNAAAQGTDADAVESAFSDTTGQWFDASANWAMKAGITNGYGNGEFGGNDNITREQAVTMLWRYAGQPGAEAAGDGEGTEAAQAQAAIDRFGDGAAVSEYAQAAMNWAIEQGIISGKGGTELAPTDTATRAEIATMAMRFCKLM